MNREITESKLLIYNFIPLVLFCCAFVFFSGTVSVAQSSVDASMEMITAEGEGEAEITGQDLGRARKEALEDALQKAFENALIRILPEGLPLTEHQVLLEELVPMKKKFLVQYRILAEMPALQVFFLTVEATFSQTILREELVRRHVYSQGGEEVEPVTVKIDLRGVTSFRLYEDLTQRLSRELAHVEDVKPLEVYGTRLVLELKYRGDPQEFEDAFNRWFSEGLLSNEDTMDVSMGFEISLSVPAAVDDVEGVPPPGDPPPLSGDTNPSLSGSPDDP